MLSWKKMCEINTRVIPETYMENAAAAGLQLALLPCYTAKAPTLAPIHREAAPALTGSPAQGTVLLFRSNQTSSLHSPSSLPSKCKGFLSWGATSVQIQSALRVQLPPFLEVVLLQLVPPDTGQVVSVVLALTKPALHCSGRIQA